MQINITLSHVAILAFVAHCAVAAAEPAAKGKLLSSMNWVEAKAALNAETVVVIPVGAESKEHGPHLPLDTDFRQAEYFKKRVLSDAEVVIAPTMNYSFYPAFVDYPGSTSLTLPVAREVLLDVIRGIAKFGPRRFYVINIGVSTNRPLAHATALLALEGITLRYLDLTGSSVRALEKQVETQKEGTHADEMETSTMLAIDATLVDMKKATVDYMPGAPRGPLSLDPKSPRYNVSGVYGDATLATVAKGRFLLEGMTKIILGEIEALRRAPPLNVAAP
jgi:creatinine amidohydrolase